MWPRKISHKVNFPWFIWGINMVFTNLFMLLEILWHQHIWQFIMNIQSDEWRATKNKAASKHTLCWICFQLGKSRGKFMLDVPSQKHYLVSFMIHLKYFWQDNSSVEIKQPHEGQTCNKICDQTVIPYLSFNWLVLFHSTWFHCRQTWQRVNFLITYCIKKFYAP
jgi:hypothetical protein